MYFTYQILLFITSYLSRQESVLFFFQHHLIYTMKQSSLKPSVKKKVTKNFKSYNTPYCANKRNEAKLIAEKWSQKFPSIVWSNTRPKVVLLVDRLSLKYYSCVILSRVLLQFQYKLPNQACYKREYLVKKFNELALK